MLTIILLTIFQQVLNWDTNILLWVNEHHSFFWDQFMYVYSGRWVWVPLYVSIAYVLVRNFSWKVTLFALLTITVIITLSDQICASLIRPIVCRLRPSNLNNPLSAVIHVVDNYRGGPFSFPSAHASNSWALTFFVIYLFRNKAISVFIVFWALLTCYSRMYLGVHYPSDLFVGMLLGLACASVVFYFFQKYSGYSHEMNLRQYNIPVIVGGLTITGIVLFSAIECYLIL